MPGYSGRSDCRLIAGTSNRLPPQALSRLNIIKKNQLPTGSLYAVFKGAQLAISDMMSEEDSASRVT